MEVGAVSAISTPPRDGCSDLCSDLNQPIMKGRSTMGINIIPQGYPLWLAVANLTEWPTPREWAARLELPGMEAMSRAEQLDQLARFGENRPGAEDLISCELIVAWQQV